MKNLSLNEALQNTDTLYEELQEISKSILASCNKEANDLIQSIRGRVDNLSDEDIRRFMLKISLVSFSFSELKEKSTLKAQCAEILKKERYATEFHKAEGSVAAKESMATLNASQEVLVEAVYTMVATSLKTKLDELHRVVDSLKSVLMSRMSEAKLTSNPFSVQE